MDKSNDNKEPQGQVRNRISLARMQAGQSGKIIRVSGGHGLARRLEALGIREGGKIKKISDQWMKGPVLLQCGSSQVALGFGMASKVLVEITGVNRQ